MTDMATRGKSVEVSAVALAAVQSICASKEFKKPTQKRVVEAALEWLASQPPEVQGVIIGSLPQSRTPDFAKMVLEGLANESAEGGPRERGKTPREAVARARAVHRTKTPRKQQSKKKRQG